PSALQNITDTANHIVERLYEVLSDNNVAAISTTLQNLQKISSQVSNSETGLEALLVSARDAARQLDTTLATTNGTVQQLDQNLVKRLPVILNKLDTTLTKIDATASNTNSILDNNHTAINNFANEGLGQFGPTLSELRSLIRDLRQISNKLENNPKRYLLGRDVPKEFDPK
ncbi:MAG TPA: MlaD family protein, partial [Xylella taiwanensis]